MDIDGKLKELKEEIAALKAKPRRTPKDDAAIIKKIDLLFDLNLKKMRQ